MKKNKWDIIGSDIQKDNDQEYAQWFDYWYDGYYYDDTDDTDGYYKWINEVWTTHISKRLKISIDRRLTGGYVDMMSIYSPQILRQKKIDYLLGIDKWDIVKKPTIGDLIKNKDNNEN